MSEYRVNYGNGQVSNTYTSKAKALADLNQDPAGCWLQMWVGDDHPDGWATIKTPEDNGPRVQRKFS